MDKKRVAYTTIVAPAQVEVTSPSGPSSFGAEAHYLCEAGIVSPKLLKEVKPNYPSSDYIRKLRQDVVLLDIIIDVDGGVLDARITKGYYPGFNEEAIKAVNQWRFKPATLNGEPVRVFAQVELSFVLR